MNANRRASTTARQIFVLLILSLPACSGVPQTNDRGLDPVARNKLFSAATTIQDQWQHLPLRGTTEYQLAVMDGQLGIRAIGRKSASGLIRRVSVDPEKCPIIEWSWGVKRIQPDADLHVKEAEDVAASMFLMFGDPGFLFDPKPVPTIRYEWTNDRLPVDAIIDNPYLSGTVRSIVVESGDKQAGAWVIERRNMSKDYEKAFGYPQKKNIQAIALFTDNDQTLQPVEAYYGLARVVCEP